MTIASVLELLSIAPCRLNEAQRERARAAMAHAHFIADGIAAASMVGGARSFRPDGGGRLPPGKSRTIASNAMRLLEA